VPSNATFFPRYQIVSGPVLQEVRQVISPWLSAVVRLWQGETSFEVEYTVGPIPVADGIGKEVLASYVVAGWSNSGGAGGEQQWATDANCRDMLVRTRDTRDWANYTNAEPISGNYYPVNCAAQV
jgi:alpha-mannosidase